MPAIRPGRPTAAVVGSFAAQSAPAVGVSAEELAKCLGRFSAVGVIDRDYSFGSPFHSGVVANEIRASLYNADKRPPLLSFICGLGGREVTLEDVNKAVDMCYAAAKSGKADAKTHWLGVRE